MAKDFVIVKGRVVRMDDQAYKIASRHFGATKRRPAQKQVPPELLKLPKMTDVIKAQPKVIKLPGKEQAPAVREVKDLQAVDKPIEVVKEVISPELVIPDGVKAPVIKPPAKKRKPKAK
jgi:hypothetical protein